MTDLEKLFARLQVMATLLQAHQLIGQAMAQAQRLGLGVIFLDHCSAAGKLVAAASACVGAVMTADAPTPVMSTRDEEKFS